MKTAFFKKHFLSTSESFSKVSPVDKYFDGWMAYSFQLHFVILSPGVFRASAVDDELHFISWFSTSHRSDSFPLCLSLPLCQKAQGYWVAGWEGVWASGSFPAPSPQGVAAASSVSSKPRAGAALPGTQDQTWLLGSRPGRSRLLHAALPFVSFLGWPQWVNHKLDGCRQQRFTRAILKVRSRVVRRVVPP